MLSKGKGGKGKGGKGKGCLKFKWEVEFADSADFLARFRSSVNGEAFDTTDIDPEGLSGGSLGGKYQSCGVPCFNATAVDSLEFDLVESTGENGLFEEDIKKIKVEMGDAKFEFPDEELEFDDNCRITFLWNSGDEDIAVSYGQCA